MDRRSFLKVSAVAAAGAAVSACAPASRRPASDNASGSSHTPVPYILHGAPLKLSFEPYELRMKETFTVSSYSRTTTPDVQVRLEYDGFTGHGEASMPQYLGHTVDSVCSFLQKVNLDGFTDPFRIEDIMEYVNSLSDGDEPAKAAIDIALHDLTGQLLGQPLYRIWGLSPEKAGDTTFTIGIDTPEVVKRKTRECADRFNILKIKVGRDTDREMVRAIREVTDLPLAVDANQGWKDRARALDMIHWLAEQGVVMVEQPMSTSRPADIAWITERSPVPIFADESFQHLRDINSLNGIFSGINIKLMKCGGLLEARKAITLARSAGMSVMLGCMVETSCATTAAAHLSPLADFRDLDGNLLISNDLYTGVKVSDGHLLLPDRPGLGLLDL